MRSFLPRDGFDLSDLLERLDVEQQLNDRQGLHMAFAITALTVDLLGRDQGERQDALKGLAQAWDYVARQHGEDVHVEYDGQPWHELSVDVDESEDASTVADDAGEATTQYAVLNTERNIFLRLGQVGPSLTTNLEKAAKHAGDGEWDSHLELVEVTTQPVENPPKPEP